MYLASIKVILLQGFEDGGSKERKVESFGFWKREATVEREEEASYEDELSFEGPYSEVQTASQE